MYRTIKGAAKRASAILVLATFYGVTTVNSAFAAPNPSPSPTPGGGGGGGGNPVGDLFSGVTPSFGPFGQVKGKAQTIIGMVWMAAIIVSIVIFIWGIVRGGFGSRFGGHRDVAEGRGLLIAGAVGLLACAAAPVVLGAIYGFGTL